MKWFIFLSIVMLHAIPPKTTYVFSDEPIDVVIPCVRKDLYTLEACIQGIKTNGKKIRRVIVLSPEPLSSSAEWFDESLFPFSKKEVALEIFHGDEAKAEEFLHMPKSRIGWIFQQLLKFYTPFVIPNISSNVLILDSDVIFLTPTDFQNYSGGPYFIPALEYTQAYFEHASRLIPWLKRVHAGHSGVAHHMLFQKPILEDLFSFIEKEHHTDPWRALCRCINPQDIPESCMSEYEIYFNFAFLRTSQAVLHPLRWRLINNLEHLTLFQRMGQSFVACPDWFRNQSNLTN